MRSTASPYLCLLSGVLYARGRRELAAVPLLLSGFGYFALLWERATGNDITKLKRAEIPRTSLEQVAGHLTLIGIGWRLVKGDRS